MKHRRHTSHVARIAGALLIAIALAVFAANSAIAETAAPAVKTETVIGGLDNPMGVAIRSSGGDLFVSESGAGRVVRIKPGKDAKPEPAISGFAVGQSPDLPDLRVGPLGLAFTVNDLLVVGSGGEGVGKDAVRIFKLPADNKPLTIDNAAKSLTIKPGDGSKTGEGYFYGVASAPNIIFAASRGDADAGWISRSLSGKQPDMVLDLKPFIESARLAHAANPTALAVSKRGELVVGQVGKLDKSPDSVLSFYNPSNGKLLLNLPTGLLDIVGLAYSPQSGLLYAVDLAWADPKEGGLYRLDATQTDNGLGVKAIKITPLDRATALCFGPNNALYVTTLGPADAKSGSAKSGQLLKITGGL